jgi:glycosyltransferase involved in cell wall biosynthesis
LNQSPKVSVVIPTIGRVATLRRVLDRFDCQSTHPSAFEVIVCADAAAEDPAAVDPLVKNRSYRASRLQAALSGASAARNVGWRSASAPLILFIDDDILPDPRLIEEHLAWHARDHAAEVGVLGDVRWAEELRVTPFMRWLEQGIQFDYRAIEGEEAVWGNFYTANASVKRVLLERVGGFDERRLPYGYEDLDLALRIHHDSGFRLLYNRRASAEHLHPMDLEFWKRRVKRIAVSEQQFVALHPEVPPYFHDLFADAAARPPVAGHIESFARLVPRRLPLIGPYVWSQLDVFYRQALAPGFLEVWEAHSISVP